MSLFIHPSRAARGLFSAATLVFILTFCSFSLSAQTCTAAATTTPVIRSEGYTEQISPVAFTCTGGTAGASVSLALYVGTTVNITNRLDSTGNPTGISVTAPIGVFTGGASFYSAMTVQISPVVYTVPNPPSTAISFTVSGILVAAANNANGSSIIPGISAQALVIGAAYSAPAGGSFLVATLAPTLLSSNINNGIPCGGSPAPPSLDFPTIIATNTSASAIRITEGSPNAFAPKVAGQDTGTRILVNLSGYPTGAAVYVPDAIVGVDPGTTPTSAGLYGIPPSAGQYSPNNNQLFLIRVNGADATGVGGTLAISKPLSTFNLSTISQLTLSGGATYAVYEVVDGNPGAVESAQIPVWVSNPQTACTGTTPTATFQVMVAPVSTVSTATQTDPIPRFMATTPGTDCTEVGDCSAGYFPTLSVNTTPLVFSSPSLGPALQNTINVGNSGAGIISFTVAVTYGTGASGWLTVTPTSGQNSAVLQVTASPATLAPGTYTATITLTAGNQTQSVPVTFNVGPVGVTIQNVGNAASFQYGTVAPGSYAVIFGLNLLGVNSTTVTFNAVPATIVYSSATQINVLVPSNLTNVFASVVVTADGMASNPFRVTLANFPGIFSNGIVNGSDGRSNSQTDPIARGNFVAVYLTGLILPLTGPVTVNIGSQTNQMPSFAGAQGTFPGLDQVNVTVPLALSATPNPVPLTVCVGTGTQQACSNAVNLYIQ